MEYLPQDENQGIAKSLWLQHAAVAFALILIFFLITISGERTSVADAQREDASTELISGDWSVKVTLFMQGLGAKQLQPQASQLLEQAVVNFRKAATKGSPGGIRRSGVLAYEQGKPKVAETFNQLTSNKVTKGLLKQDIAELRSEAEMWRDIYSDTGRISPEKARAYAARINKLNLGPVRSYALSHVYRFSGQDRLAARVMAEGRQRAAGSVIPGTLLMMILFAAGLAGIVFIVIFMNRSKTPADETIEQPRPTGFARPWVLFQAFTIYIGLMFVFSMAAGIVAVPALKPLEAEQRLFYTVVLQFGLSAVTGLIALVALARILKANGGTFVDIGLTAKDFGKNVLWGVAGYCALIPFLLIAALISTVLFKRFETPQHPIVPMLLSGDMIVFAILFVTGSVLAPFFEETFFRGLLYRGLRARMTFAGAVILSAVAFSIVHPQLPAGFLPIFVIGAVFAVLAETRQSLVPSMIAHAINNGVVFLIMYFFFIA